MIDRLKFHFNFSKRWLFSLEILIKIGTGLISALLAVIALYRFAHWIRIEGVRKTRLKQQLYQGGETILPRKRRYLDQTFIWISYFTTAHVISFMFATLIILSLGVAINFIYPLVYFTITSFAIFMLAIKSPNS